MSAEIEGIPIVYADDSILVLNKPSGLLSVPGKGEGKQDCLSARVQNRYPGALVVHRLDMATSGLILMARSLVAQRKLNHAFAAREVHKRYVAVVHGAMQVSTAWQTIDLPILVDWPNRPLRKIALENGKPSISRFRCVGSDPIANTSRLELEPLTGRSHQLRVHLQAVGHPIVGDALYNHSSNITSQPAMTGATHLHLHACELGLEHPVNGTLVRWHCPAAF